MNIQPSNTPHKVYLVDLEEPLLNLLSVIADYCDERDMYTEQDILMSALNLLMISYCVSEAAEAMEIDLNTYCRYRHTRHNRRRIRAAVELYLNAMHNQFQALGFYGEDAHLKYTFGGWHAPYTPLFIPHTHLRSYRNAIPAIVDSEPLDRHPGKIFHPFPLDDPDPVLPELS